MKIYERSGGDFICGYWNGSPIEIRLTEVMMEIPPGEVSHYHDYREYYLILRGRASLTVEGEAVPLEPDTLVMVEPGEKHRVAWVHPSEGIQWVLIKERSVPDGKVIVPEGED